MANTTTTLSLPHLYQSHTSLATCDGMINTPESDLSDNSDNIADSPLSLNHVRFSTLSSISSDSEIDDIPFMELLAQLAQTEEDLTVQENGYKKVEKICDTLQGELLKCEVSKSTLPNRCVGSYVAIKKTDKALFEQHIVVQNDMTCFVSEDILNEAQILQTLSNTGDKSNEKIVEYIDMFESECYIYLVMAYVENGITLKEFVRKSFELINDGQLTLKEYSKTVRLIMWQLSNTVQWMHSVANVCHLDLCLENVMVQNSEYIAGSDGYLKTNEFMTVKLCDFGVAEDFSNDASFLCNKNTLSIYNGLYMAPEVNNGSSVEFDARSVDCWSLGMVFYLCMVGEPLFEAEHMWPNPQCGYLALTNNKLRQYLAIHDLLKYFKRSSFNLLKHLLRMEPSQRFNATQVVNHRFFAPYALQ